ncbi:MAG: hypothetical protein IPO86_04840 [Saprospiraceae bacterium]|nr:hypothetical protein [Saprospiraceae bacterium]
MYPLHYLLLTTILITTSLKFSLIGCGFLAFPDEARYVESAKALVAFSEFKFRLAINAIFSTQGRPGEAILKIFPNGIQYITAQIFDLNYYESKNSSPLFIFNFSIYCFLLFVHYKISKLLLSDLWLSLISVLVFSSLINSYLYIRHALPYDSSLLILYVCIYKTIVYTQNEALSIKKSILLAAFSFLGFLVYPGYFVLYIYNFWLFLFNTINKQTLTARLIYGFYFILTCVCCLLFVEIFARLGSQSYLQEALNLSKTITQGSFDESFSFLQKYLIEVEGPGGIILLIGLCLYFILILKKIISGIDNSKKYTEFIFIPLILLFLIYAYFGFYQNKVLFYGRLIHQYIPFVCILSVYSINEIIGKFKSIQKFVWLLLSSVFILNFAVCFKNYASISYPRDIYWSLYNSQIVTALETVCEYENAWSKIPASKEIRMKSNDLQSKHETQNILAINLCYFYPVNDPIKYHPFIVDKNYNLINSWPHFLNFKAYQFEGFNKLERQNLDSFNFQMKIYAKQ